MTYTPRMKKSIYEGGLSGKAPSAFRRVHYEFIADTIKNLGLGYAAQAQIAMDFDKRFAPIAGYNSARFLRACGVNV